MDNATGAWCLARLTSRSRMLGSVDAPEPGFRPGARWGWCHGGVLQSVGRSEILLSTPTLPGFGLRARRLPVSRSEQRASSAATSPGPREAGAHGYPGTPDRRPLGAWPNCRPCAEYSPPKFIGGLSLTVMDGGRTLRHPSAAAWAACRRPLRSCSFPYTISACRRRA